MYGPNLERCKATATPTEIKGNWQYMIIYQCSLEVKQTWITVLRSISERKAVDRFLAKTTFCSTTYLPGDSRAALALTWPRNYKPHWQRHVRFQQEKQSEPYPSPHNVSLICRHLCQLIWAQSKPFCFHPHPFYQILGRPGEFYFMLK